MNTDLRRVEQKLRLIIAQRDCPLCNERVGRCPHCGSPQGALPSEAQHSAHLLNAKLDEMSRKIRLAASLALVGEVEGVEVGNVEW